MGWPWVAGCTLAWAAACVIRHLESFDPHDARLRLASLQLSLRLQQRLQLRCGLWARVAEGAARRSAGPMKLLAWQRHVRHKSLLDRRRIARLEGLVHVSEGLGLFHHKALSMIATAVAPARVEKIIRVAQRGKVEDNVDLRLKALCRAVEVELGQHAAALLLEPTVDNHGENFQAAEPCRRGSCRDSLSQSFEDVVLTSRPGRVKGYKNAGSRGRWPSARNSQSLRLPPVQGSCQKGLQRYRHVRLERHMTVFAGLDAKAVLDLLNERAKTG
eukprot:6179908-Pleurochrysis_carterae.AAC.3